MNSYKKEKIEKMIKKNLQYIEDLKSFDFLEDKNEFIEITEYCNEYLKKQIKSV